MKHVIEELMPSKVAFVQRYLRMTADVIASIPPDQIAGVLAILERAHRDGRRVYVAGNGGSASTASHMANDLLKGVAVGRERGFRACSLSDNVSVVTAIANDTGYERVFAAQIEEAAEAGDVLIVISASGNSPNILAAIVAAREKGCSTVGLLGMGGGAAARLVDQAVVVGADDYGSVENAHLTIEHLFVEYFLRRGGEFQ